MRSSPLLLALSLLSAALFAQDDPAARAVVVSAAQAQVPSGAAPVVHDFQADLNVTIFEKDAGGGSPIARTGQVTEYWLRRNGRTYYRRELRDDARGVTELGWTGTGGWLRKDGGTTLSLDQDPALQRDREQLMEEMRRVEELVDHLFLYNLAAEGTSLRFKQRGVKVSLESGPVVADEILRTKEGDEPILILIAEPGTGGVRRVAEIRIRPGTADEDRLVFDFHEPLERPAGHDGPPLVVIPTRVDYYRGGRHTLQASARSAQAIKINTGLKPAFFRSR